MTPRATYLDAAAIAEALGNARTGNVVLLGALSALLEQPGGPGLAGIRLEPETWLEVIMARVPAKYSDLNRRAFLAGREAVSS